MVEITDLDSAFLWLEKQDHQTCVWLAARCALRALPATGLLGVETTSELVFLTFRANLILTAASSRPNNKLKEFGPKTDAAGKAVQAVFWAASTPPAAENVKSIETLRYLILDAIITVTTSPSVPHRPDFMRGPHIEPSSAAGNAATTITGSAGIIPASSGNRSMINISASDSNFAAATFHVVSKDTDAPLKWSSLWPSGGLQVDLEQGWNTLKEHWMAESEVWSF